MRKNTIRKSITLFSVLCLGTPVSAWAIDINTEKPEESKKIELPSTITNTPQTETVNSMAEKTNSSNVSDSQESVDMAKDSSENTLSSENNSETSGEVATDESSSIISEDINLDAKDAGFKNDEQKNIHSDKLDENEEKQTKAVGSSNYSEMYLTEYFDAAWDNVNDVWNVTGIKKDIDGRIVVPTAVYNHHHHDWVFDVQISQSFWDSVKNYSNKLNITSFEISVQNSIPLIGYGGKSTTWDLSNLFGISYRNLTKVDFRGLGWWHVKNTTGMFDSCYKLTTFLFDGPNVNSEVNTWKNIESTERMFSSCHSLTNLSSFRNIDMSNNKSMAGMFSTLDVTSLDFSNVNTINVKDFSNSFAYCYKLENLNISNLKTNAATNLSYMFAYSDISHIDLTSFDTKLVTDFSYMFRGCDFLKYIDLTNFTISSQANLKSMFSTNFSTPLLVKTNSTVLYNYEYNNDRRVPNGPKFNTNGGKFDDQQTTKTYFDSCAISPQDPKLQLTTFQQFKQDLKPTRDSYLFESWNLTEGNEPISNTDLFKSATYTAQWTPSLENGNIPSQDVDNVKPGTTSIYGIAYMPKAFTIPSTKLTDETTQTIPINSTSSYHVAVRDQRMTQGGWTLQAQLVWDNNALPGSSIQTGNGEGVIKKNNNNGLTDFQASDLVENDGTVTGVANVKIGTTPTTIMTGQNVSHNGVYDYDLGKMSLILENANTIQAGTYTGNINWNLTNAP